MGNEKITFSDKMHVLWGILLFAEEHVDKLQIFASGYDIKKIVRAIEKDVEELNEINLEKNDNKEIKNGQQELFDKESVCEIQ